MFCPGSSVWHQAGSKVLCICFIPLDDDFDEQMPRHSCTKGELQLRLQKYFSSNSCQLWGGGGGERGKPENTQETKHLRFCGAVQEVPDSLAGKVTFFPHWAFFRRLASLPLTKWSCQFVFPPHQQEPLGVRKQSRRVLNGTRRQKGKKCRSLLEKKVLINLLYSSKNLHKYKVQAKQALMKYSVKGESVCFTRLRSKRENITWLKSPWSCLDNRRPTRREDELGHSEGRRCLRVCFWC